MMIEENECVGCEHCGSCGSDHVERFYCDKCGAEETLYEFDGHELCLHCIKDKLTVVEGSEI